MSYVWLNDEMVNRNQASIDIEDRGYQFGDGIYEVIRVYNGKMFTVKEHLERLYESAASIYLKIPYDLDELQGKLEELIARNQLNLGTVYLQFTRGISARKHPFPLPDVLPTFVAYTKEAGVPLSKQNSGVEAIIEDDIRWLRCNIKSLNLLGNLLANQKAAEKGCDEAILHREGSVTEGSHSNVSIVKDGKVITHPANNFILNGISRQVMLQICESSGIHVEERVFTLDELKQADEVFLTGTTIEVMPIVRIDGDIVGKGVPGELTKQLQEKFRKRIEQECGVFEGAV